LEEVEGMEHQNLTVELLKKLLRDEIKAQRRTNIVQSRQLTEMLEESLWRYQNQVISLTLLDLKVRGFFLHRDSDEFPL
jgi:type I restriction enzyme R subunit